MTAADELDALFREAVAAIDAGDVATLERLLAEHPALLSERLAAPRAWLRDQVGTALDGFFARPYLLWFVAEDPTRTGRLPANIAAVTRAILAAAQRAGVSLLGEPLDYALKLVCWSPVAAQAGAQLALIDVLAEAGAALADCADNALVNSHYAAAEHLVGRGAALTLATALCLGRWDDAARMGPAASARDKQFALTLCALRGRAEALRQLLAWGVEVNERCPDLYPHGTPLHHAVSSGVLEAVQVVLAAGGDLAARDTAFDGTPLGWAEYAVAQQPAEAQDPERAAIVTYLRERVAARSSA